ncbi:MAG: ABC transporter permease [Rhodospirillaceae bacterium]|nr:ABC transporter permease [Rhodospirillaceae bacterium]
MQFFLNNRITIEVRQEIPQIRRFYVLTCALLFGLIVSLSILINVGVDLSSIYEEFIVFTFFNSSGVSNVIVEATPLILVGLCAAIAFRINYWNIGIEGQIFMGTVGCTMIAIYDIGPESTRLFVMLILSLLFSALWALPPALLKVKLKINEIITTLLFNYFAFYFVLHQVYGAWKDPVDQWPHSEQYDSFERIPQIGWEELNWGILIAIFAVIIIWWAFEKTRFAFQSRFVGANQNMALAIGLPVAMITVISAMASGALAGATGFVIASAHEFRLSPPMVLGYAFSGIVIAFLSGNQPFKIVLVAFLMGGLYVAGESMKVFYNLPDSIIGLIQAIIVLSITASEFFIRYRLLFVSLHRSS